VFADIAVQLANGDINGFNLKLGLLYLCVKSVYLGLERLVLATAIILASGPAGKPGFISLAGAIGLLLWAEKRGSPK
jgi:hypothetical protein